MQLFGYFLLLLSVSPLASQQPYEGCLSTHFNCITTNVYGQFSDHVTYHTQVTLPNMSLYLPSTERMYYDEDRQMMVREETGQTNGKAFWELRIFDYPKGILYYITRPGGEEICTKNILTKPFQKVCIPDTRQEIWLKSILGKENDMVPTVRFKWEVGNVTTELTYTYFKQPVIQNWYGIRNDPVLGPVPVFKTSLFTNITVNDVGPTVFTPPRTCDNVGIERERSFYKHSDNHIF